MRKRALGFVGVAVFAMMIVGLQGVAAGPVQTLTACLKIVPGEPLGTATYSWWDEDTSRLEISVAGVEQTGNYCVFIDKEKLADVTFVVDDTGAGSLRLDTRWGDIIPPIESGSKIALKWCENTDIALCGQFV